MTQAVDLQALDMRSPPRVVLHHGPLGRLAGAAEPREFAYGALNILSCYAVVDVRRYGGGRAPVTVKVQHMTAPDTWEDLVTSDPIAVSGRYTYLHTSSLPGTSTLRCTWAYGEGTTPDDAWAEVYLVLRAIGID